MVVLSTNRNIFYRMVLPYTPTRQISTTASPRTAISTFSSITVSVNTFVPMASTPTELMVFGHTSSVSFSQRIIVFPSTMYCVTQTSRCTVGIPANGTLHSVLRTCSRRLLSPLITLTFLAFQVWSALSIFVSTV